MRRVLVLVSVVVLVLNSFAVKVGFIATNFSAESQARVANAFEQLAKAKGWETVMLNSRGSYETQANQVENLVQMKVDAIILAMGHPLEIKPRP